MLEPLQVRISRDGKEIGTYPAAEVVRLRTNGTLKETDFYWCEGMTDWAPLTEFLAAEARRQLAEKELLKKQEDAKRAERLAQEKAKAKEEEDRQVAEATEIRMQKRKENFFTCNCCKARFEKPNDPRDLFWKGLLFVFVGWWPGVFAFGLTGSSRNEPPIVIILGLGLLSLIITLQGFVLVLSSGLRSPYCPGCHSTDYSRPNSDIRPVFD